MKTAGYVIGGTLIVGGIVSIIIGEKQNKYSYEVFSTSSNNIYHSKIYNDDRNIYFYAGYGAIAGGVAVGVPLILKGSSLQRKYGKQVHATSVISKDINFSNGSCLNLGVDLLSSNLSSAKTTGLGIRYNF